MSAGGEDLHTFGWGDVSIDVDPATGGRVTALRLGGRNLLTGPEVDPGNYGSTFWTSPQSAWGWPPVPEIDHAPYRVVQASDALVLRGQPSAALGVSVEKRFRADGARGAMVSEFRIHNHGPSPVKLAPWQITRVGTGGLTFFPSGDGIFPPSNLSVRATPDITWYAYDAVAITDHQKLYADGREGWLAHVDGDALLVKRFEPVPRARHAPGEAQIEIYANPTHTYVEVEAQGAYDEIAPGGTLAWPMVWLVRRLPASLLREAGSAALAAHVRALVAADARAAAAAG
jgi:hypothetical protein